MEYLALKNIIRKKHTRRREILSFGDRMKEKMATAPFFLVFFFSDAKHGEENGMIVENN